MVWALVALGLASPFVPVAAVGAWAGARRLRDSVSRYRRARAEGAKLTKVCGVLRALRPVQSPLEKANCCFSVTLLRGEGRLVRSVLRNEQFFTGHDFLLEAGDAVYFVRAAGAQLRLPGGIGTFIADPLRQELPPALAAAVAASRLASSRFFRWAELKFESGAQVEITGVCRDEPAPPDVPFGGLRDRPNLPTLSAAGGVLEIGIPGLPFGFVPVPRDEKAEEIVRFALDQLRSRSDDRE